MPDSTLGGVGVFDCDGDGLLDIYFTNGARFPDLEKADPSFPQPPLPESRKTEGSRR